MRTATVINATGHWGALVADWDHFSFVLGLTGDLLPVVSNPEAKISPDSKLASKGKVPSVYNGGGMVVGMKGWTKQESTDRDLRRWRAVTDYGICVQTRLVRALDVDVADETFAARIKARIGAVLGVALPCRTRGNAAKFLLAFEMAGEHPKRIIKTAGGNIEFLGTGQQFVAVGTHPSRVRYLWEGGLPFDIPPVDAGAFEHLWGVLADEFGGGESVTVGAGRRQGSGTGVAPAEDPIGDYLDAQGWTMAEGRAGERHIRCPFEDGHSMGQAGDGSTTYFPPDASFARGHFKCLHGSCAHRTDGDFLGAVGYQQDVFADMVPPDEVLAAAPAPLPSFARDRAGRIEATVENVSRALRHPEMAECEIRYDRFKDEIVWQPAGVRGREWRPIGDADYVRLRITLERRGFKPVGRELIRDTVMLAADEQQIDTAREWLTGLRWDGVSRVATFLADCFGAGGGEYTEAVSRYLWTALAGRVLDPGCKADMVPTLIGAQGIGKTEGVAALVPSADFHCEISFHEKDDDLARKMRGRLVAEIGELRGLHTRELEGIKAFITRRHENWVPKYREFATSFPRRLVFVATTNEEQFLADQTGHRRWLPVQVSRADVERIRGDREQLWAEAAVMYLLGGIEYQDAERLARDVHADHEIVDPWADAVERWLREDDVLAGDVPGERAWLQVTDVLRGALGFKDQQIKRSDEMRAGAALRTLGYTRKKARVGARLLWVFAKTGGFVPGAQSAPVPTKVGTFAEGGNTQTQ